MATVLHRGGFPPLSPESIGKAFRDGRAYRRFDGAPRQYRIGPPTVRFALPDAIITVAVSVLIGMICVGAFA